MGIDFNNLIKNLGHVAANMQNDKTKIDTKTELNTYVSGWDAIKAKAEAENSANAEAKVDIASLEGDMKSELASLMGAEFGKSAGVQNKGDAQKPVFSEDEISLENMMALLAPEDGMDIDKLREYNKKPMLSAESESVDTLTDAGFDSELVEIMVESTPGAVKYISDAIKSGSADRIANDTAAFEKDIEGARNVLSAMAELLTGDVQSMIPDYTGTKPTSGENKNDIEGARRILSEMLNRDIQSMTPDYTETNTTSDKSAFEEITEFMEEDNK